LISSGYKKALEIIEQRYHPAHWNVYAFHCSTATTSSPTTRRRSRPRANSVPCATCSATARSSRWARTTTRVRC
jgi:hypothetical protein